VETIGFEPTTPCLQSRCSSQLSYVPWWSWTGVYSVGEMILRAGSYCSPTMRP
jgi:hypothetical protein